MTEIGSEGHQPRSFKILVAGTTVSRYALFSRTGAGRLGEAYLADHTLLDRKVALKDLLLRLCQNDDRRRRSLR